MIIGCISRRWHHWETPWVNGGYEIIRHWIQNTSFSENKNIKENWRLKKTEEILHGICTCQGKVQTNTQWKCSDWEELNVFRCFSYTKPNAINKLLYWRVIIHIASLHLARRSSMKVIFFLDFLKYKLLTSVFSADQQVSVQNERVHRCHCQSDHIFIILRKYARHVIVPGLKENQVFIFQVLYIAGQILGQHFFSVLLKDFISLSVKLK